MKKSEIKMKLALLISGLAFFVFSSLQCAAQDIWGIWVEQKGEESRYFSVRGQLFRGDKETCEQKCAELNARYSDNGKRDARAVAEKMEEMGSFTISEDAKQQGEEYENELKKDPQNTFGLPKYSPKILPSSLLFTKSEYEQIAKEYVRTLYSGNSIDYDAYMTKKYKELCGTHNYEGNEKDYNDFENKLWETINSNFAKFLPNKQYEEWVSPEGDYDWYNKWSVWPNNDFTSFAKKYYLIARKEYDLEQNFQKYGEDFDIFQDRLGDTINLEFDKLEKRRPKNY